MDDAASTIRDWRDKGVYEVLDRYYAEIWVYGDREFYDPISQYAIPDNISAKMVFTGYIPRHERTGWGAAGRHGGFRFSAWPFDLDRYRHAFGRDLQRARGRPPSG